MGMNVHADRLSLAFAALADPTRRAILARLASGEADVSELMKPFALSQPTISKHLNVLERAGLVVRGRRKKEIRIRADFERIPVQAKKFLIHDFTRGRR